MISSFSSVNRAFSAPGRVPAAGARGNGPAAPPGAQAERQVEELNENAGVGVELPPHSEADSRPPGEKTPARTGVTLVRGDGQTRGTLLDVII